MNSYYYQSMNKSIKVKIAIQTSKINTLLGDAFPYMLLDIEVNYSYFICQTNSKPNCNFFQQTLKQQFSNSIQFCGNNLDQFCNSHALAVSITTHAHFQHLVIIHGCAFVVQNHQASIVCFLPLHGLLEPLFFLKDHSLLVHRALGSSSFELGLTYLKRVKSTQKDDVKHHFPKLTPRQAAPIKSFNLSSLLALSS